MHAQVRRKGNEGFTLVELAITMGALTIISAAMYGIAMGMVTAAKTQDALITLRQESRLAMQSIVQNVRSSQASSLQTNLGGGFVDLDNNPTSNLQFRRVDDIDGNGTALNQDLSMGLTQQFWYTVDTNDVNGDGQTITQLVQMRQDGTVGRVLANHVSPVVRTADFYDTPLGGVVFQDVGGGSIQVTLIMRYQPDPTGPMMVTRLDELVTPRN